MSAYLLLSIRLPEVDAASCDPEQLADELVAVINEARRANGLGDAGVGLFPACEWLTAKTFERLKAAVALLSPDTTETP